MTAATTQATDSVETLSGQIAELVTERQGLRTGGADADALERNRIEIASLQHRLSQALIARYLPMTA